MKTHIPNQLRELWVGFTAYKATHLNPNTIIKTYGGKARLLEQIPIYCTTAQDDPDRLPELPKSPLDTSSKRTS